MPGSAKTKRYGMGKFGKRSVPAERSSMRKARLASQSSQGATSSEVIARNAGRPGKTKRGRGPKRG